VLHLVTFSFWGNELHTKWGVVSVRWPAILHHARPFSLMNNNEMELNHQILPFRLIEENKVTSKKRGNIIIQIALAYPTIG
jgi:hypothetical protein